MPSRAVIKAQIDQLAKQLRVLDKFPEEDPFHDGSLLRFQKTYGKGRSSFHHTNTGRYLYAAVRASGKWYLTGHIDYAMTWDELVEFLSDGVDEVQFAPHVVPAFD